MLNVSDKMALSYIIGVALGDGNLSNPNKRAVRLRITCDIKYPQVISEITESLKIIAPYNKISLIKRKNKNAIDISCYSNDWEMILGWKAKGGSKMKQEVCVPGWIMEEKIYIENCLKGLIQTDGSIYKDREYTTVNFVSCIPALAKDVFIMIETIGFKPNMQIIQEYKSHKHTIRVTRDSNKFIESINLTK